MQLLFFLGVKNSMTIFPLSSIPKSFLQQVEECMSYFTNLQINAIKENLMLYPLKDDKIIQQLNDLKEVCVKEYVQRYHVDSSIICNYWKLYQPKKQVCFISVFNIKFLQRKEILYIFKKLIK